MVIKVADFGLSVNIGTKEYYRLTRHVDVKLPVKWMAPESLADYIFSEMSDVVSAHNLLWDGMFLIYILALLRSRLWQIIPQSHLLFYSFIIRY